MKLKTIISAHSTMIVSYCLILISGYSFGGFYSFYILLGLRYGALHSLLAVMGILVIVISRYRLKTSQPGPTDLVLNFAGVGLLYLALFCFFFKDDSGYNLQTFYQLIPLLSIILFLIISVAFLRNRLTLFHQTGTNNRP